MAKRKKDIGVENDSCSDLVSRVCGDINKEQFLSGNSLVELEKQIIPISPCLDIITGGLLEGSVMIASGPPKNGKSLLALSICANAQKPENGNRNVWYLPIEGRLNKRDIEGIKDLNKDKFFVPQSTEDKIISGEEYFKIAKSAIFEDPGCVIVFDSLSMLCSEDEMSEELGKQYMAPPIYKLVGQFFRQCATAIPIKRSIVIFIVQDSANVSGYGKKYVEKIPNTLKHQANYKIRANKTEIITDGNAVPIGLKPTWISEHSPITGPMRTIEGRITFGVGIDEVAEIFNLGLNLPNTITKKNAGWYILDFFDEEKIQGEENVINFLKENDPAYQLLKTTVKSFIK